MSPVTDFLWLVRTYGVDRRYAARAGLYLAKAIAWEPLRLAERALAAVRQEPKALPKAPVFILGYYRSGTTHLQETLLEDPQFGYLNFFHCFFSGAFNLAEPWAKPVFERIVRAIGMRHPAHGTPFSFDLPGEEDVGMVAGGSRLAANWGQTLPRDFQSIYRRLGLLQNIPHDEREALKEYFADLFWRVSKANGHKRLLLKSPPQLGRVALLDELYPDAKYVFIRRNPYDVFASNKKLWKSFQKTWLHDDLDDDTVRENILWSYVECHRAYERDKAAFRPGQLCEIGYEDFRARPVETLEHVYRTLDLGDFEAVRERFDAYLAETHQTSQPPYRLTDAERRAIGSTLAPWIDRWGYDASATTT